MKAERVLLVFLDGVGIGGPDPERNPFLRAHAPALARFWGEAPPTRGEPARSGPSGFAFPLDASLGVEGLPQSGTGQAALLTGLDTAATFGRHFGPWVPVRLRPAVEERACSAWSRGRGPRWRSPTPTRGAGPEPGGVAASPALRSRRAAPASSTVTRTRSPAGTPYPARSSTTAGAGTWVTSTSRRSSRRPAGRNLARIAGTHRLTLYAHYATDTAGHARDMRRRRRSARTRGSLPRRGRSTRSTRIRSFSSRAITVTSRTSRKATPATRPSAWRPAPRPTGRPTLDDLPSGRSFHQGSAGPNEDDGWPGSPCP